MLTLLDIMLRDLLLRRVQALTPGGVTPLDEQIGFAPPDQEWVDFVVSLQENALNVYLVEMRENVTMRSNERVTRFADGMVYEQPAPQFMDCHYLISAWSPISSITPGIEPTVDEHQLLYETTAVLFNNIPLTPSRIYPLASEGLAAWEPFEDFELPTLVAPVEGYLKLAEFWGTMGQNRRWKPCVHLIVTLPVVITELEIGGIVTTRSTSYLLTAHREHGEELVQIGGYVLRGADRDPVEGIWVGLRVRATGRLHSTTYTNARGEFTFAGLQRGDFILNLRAPGINQTQNISVPSDEGHYEVVL